MHSEKYVQTLIAGVPFYNLSQCSVFFVKMCGNEQTSKRTEVHGAWFTIEWAKVINWKIRLVCYFLLRFIFTITKFMGIKIVCAEKLILKLYRSDK